MLNPETQRIPSILQLYFVSRTHFTKTDLKKAAITSWNGTICILKSKSIVFHYSVSIVVKNKNVDSCGLKKAALISFAGSPHLTLVHILATKQNFSKRPKTLINTKTNANHSVRKLTFKTARTKGLDALI